MNEMTGFEHRLADRLQTFARLADVPFDAAAIAHAAVAGSPARRRFHLLLPRMSPQLAVLAATALLLALVAGAVATVGFWRPWVETPQRPAHASFAMVDPDGALLLVDANGARSSVAEADLCPAHPRWSPDGERLAFVTGCGGSDVADADLQVAIWDRATGRTSSVGTGRSAQFEGRLTLGWAPDGHSLVLTGTTLHYGWLSMGAIVIRDGVSGSYRLTEGADTAAFSPDGRYLSVAIGGDIFLVPADRVEDAYIIPADDYKVIGPLTETDVPRLHAAHAQIVELAWRPDGGAIVFSAGGVNWIGANDAGPLASNSPLIGIISSAGGEATTLAEDAHAPAWSPDGQRIAYQVGYRERSELWVMAADGSGKHRLAPAMSAEAPAWSPDGTRISFSDAAGHWFAIRPDGSDLYQLPLSAPDASGVDWQPIAADD